MNDWNYIYRNKRTGEKTRSHAVAKHSWYKDQHDEVEVWRFSKTLNEWIIGWEWTW